MRGFISLAVAAALAGLAFTQGNARAGQLETLYSFCSLANCTDGAKPNGGRLLVDPVGNIYGTTNAGGVSNNLDAGGVVFQLSPNAKKTKYRYRVIHEFCSELDCFDGNAPRSADLIMDTSGRLYGVTAYGGSTAAQCTDGVSQQHCGVVYQLTPSSTGKHWKLRVLYSFCLAANCADGAVPWAGLTYAGASSGALYDGTSPLFGTTTRGGSHGDANNGGTVFELSTSNGHKWKEKVLYSFCSQANCADGEFPHDTLTMDGSGNLYGTTSFGGNANSGVVFKLAVSRHPHETVLYSFCSASGCADGAIPDLGPSLSSSSGLLGVTSEGGNGFGDGVLYKVDNGTETVLYTFCPVIGCSDGWAPSSTPVLDASGNLFGTTAFGGVNDLFGGVLYEYSSTGNYSVLYSFCALASCADGEAPAGVAMDSPGHLVGVTGSSGTHNSGTVFAYTQ